MRRTISTIFIIFLSGCVTQNIKCQDTNSSEQVNWYIDSRNQIERLGQTYEEYDCEKNNIFSNYPPQGTSIEFEENILRFFGKDSKDISSELRKNYWLAKHKTDNFSKLNNELIRQCYDLWEITGQPLFLDTPCNKLPENIPEVINRYNKYISSNKNIEREKLLREAIRENIEAINTEYLNWAYQVIKKYIAFDGVFGEAGFHKDCYCILGKSDEFFKKQFLDEYHIWLKWYLHNKDNLVWNSQKTMFEHNQKVCFETPYRKNRDRHLLK